VNVGQPEGHAILHRQHRSSYDGLRRTELGKEGCAASLARRIRTEDGGNRGILRHHSSLRGNLVESPLRLIGSCKISSLSK
jgi:hypothetical protein